MDMKSGRWIVAILCQWLALSPVFAQQSGLRIVIVEGTGARNVAQEIAPRPLIVRVEEANNQPVSGATVTFTAPGIGPSGEFENDTRTYRTITGEDGLAGSGPYHPNLATGDYQIQVRAEFQGQTATAFIRQANVGARKSRGKLFAIAAVAGAAVVAAIAAGSGGRQTTTTPPTPTPTPSPTAPSISLGGSAVGAPNQ